MEEFSRSIGKIINFFKRYETICKNHIVIRGNEISKKIIINTCTFHYAIFI